MASETLAGWKAIAAWFGTTVRTVQRWETHEGLPVRRVRRSRRDAVEVEIRELERWVKTCSKSPWLVTPKASLAVLPFVCRTQPWLGEELAAEVVQTLAQAPGLQVYGRASTFGVAAGQPEPGRAVAATLDVSTWLEGELAPTSGANQWRLGFRLVSREGVVCGRTPGRRRRWKRGSGSMSWRGPLPVLFAYACRCNWTVSHRR